MALDQATRSFVQQMRDSGTPPLHTMTPTQARALSASVTGLYGGGPDVQEIRDYVVSAENGQQFVVRRYLPHGTPRANLVYYHGGGWVIGTLEEFDALARTLTARTSCAVALVDYRLAPEHPFPAAADDAWTALSWVRRQAASGAWEQLPLIVMGDSAGGNLAAVVAQRAAEAGGPEIDLQVLVYPVTAADFGTDSYRDPANELLLTRDSMIWFWDHYAPNAADRRLPAASPLLAPALGGVAPAVVLTAEHDVLRDEGEAYAEALREAGVRVRSLRCAGQMHGFFTLVNVLPGSAAAINHVAAAVSEELNERG